MFYDFLPFWMMSIMFFAIISVLVSAFGYYASKNETDELKTLIKQKYRYYALIPLIFGVFVSVPYVPSFTRLGTADKLKPTDLSSIEKIADFEKEQSRQIELLKSEIENLRKDVITLRDYLVFILPIILVILVGTGTSNIAEINKKILDEERKRNILNL
jgi:hypothetical protein